NKRDSRDWAGAVDPIRQYRVTAPRESSGDLSISAGAVSRRFARSPELSRPQKDSDRWAVRGETVMAWLLSMVALSLVMTALTVAELRQPAKTTAFARLDLIFVVVTFTVSLIYGLMLLAAAIPP